jgi:hypothetical protein
MVPPNYLESKVQTSNHNSNGRARKKMEKIQLLAEVKSKDCQYLKLPVHELNPAIMHFNYHYQNGSDLPIKFMMFIPFHPKKDKISG